MFKMIHWGTTNSSHNLNACYWLVFQKYTLSCKNCWCHVPAYNYQIDLKKLCFKQISPLIVYYNHTQLTYYVFPFKVCHFFPYSECLNKINLVDWTIIQHYVPRWTVIIFLMDAFLFTICSFVQSRSQVAYV